MDVRAPTRNQERPLPSPSYPCAPSRSSTSTSVTRMTPQSAGSLTSHFASSSTPSSAHPLHRFHHTSCGPQSTVASRPASAASRERGSGPGSGSGRRSATSSYLQEKLQKRREEAERLAAVRSSPDMDPSMELPVASSQGSPVVKGGYADGRRPGSSGGGNSESVNKGMGLKEMEATVSTLHKQNFDLKLELFHRRERQNVLEERIDALEAEKAQIDNVNDKLLDELEKRDKAVHEAVQMIVALEAQVETLFKEREMVRQVDEARCLSLDKIESKLREPTPKPGIADLAGLEEATKRLNRMPSFVSERTENTENLRRVYLSSRGSLLSMHRRTTEAREDGDGRQANSLVSPSLSVLSESSFVSVYGEREGENQIQNQTQGQDQDQDQDQDQTVVADTDEPSPIDGNSRNSRLRAPSHGSDKINFQGPATATPARPRGSSRSSSTGRIPGPGQFQSIHDIIDHTSPLQRLARLDRVYMDKSPTQTHSPGRIQSQTHVKGPKREFFRRVTTDTPISRSGDQTLPPTPDTISTSTLRRFKNSNETLAHQRGVSDQRSYPSISEGTSKANDVENTGGAPVFQQPLVTAFGNKPASAVQFDDHPSLVPRPRSADELTVSHRGALDWDSDGDSLHSLDSSLDIWLQQGREPARDERSGGESPDLFSFPPSGAGWAADTMFGSAGGAFDTRGAALGPSNPTRDLISAQEALFPDTTEPPPPPNRRSSLSARTGSFSRQPPVNGKLCKSPPVGVSRRNSIDAHLVQLAESVARGDHHSEAKPGGRWKDNHYPPVSGATPRGNRLNFFRRSVSGASTSAPPESAPPPTAEKAAAVPNDSMGVPSWVHRGYPLDGDRSAATPPPIMRKHPPMHSASFDKGAPIAKEAPVDERAPATPKTPATPATASACPTSTAKADAASRETTPASNASGGGAPLGKRKWLPGFGRTSSLRTRAG